MLFKKKIKPKKKKKYINHQNAVKGKPFIFQNAQNERNETEKPGFPR